MATYTKAGFGKLDDFRTGFYKTGYGRLDDWGERDYVRVQVGNGRAGLVGRGVAVKTTQGVQVKAGFGAAGGLGSGSKVGGVGSGWTYTKANATIPWPEPPFMEYALGLVAVGYGFAEKATATGFARAGRGSAGVAGSGARLSVFVEKGFGTASGFGSGPWASATIARGYGNVGASGGGVGAFGYVSKKGFGAAGLAPFGVTGLVPATGSTLVRVGVWDDVSVAGVTLLVDGVAYGDEVTGGLANLIPNGTVDANANGWAAHGSADVRRVTASPKHGAGCLSVDASASDTGVVYTSVSPWIAGKTYRVAGWVKGTASEWVEFWVGESSGRIIKQQGIQMTGAWQYIEIDCLLVETQAHYLYAVSKTGPQTFFLDTFTAIQHAEFVVESTELRNGLHTVSARVRDPAGGSTTAYPWSINVSNPALPYPELRVEVGFDSAPSDSPQIWTDVTGDYLEGTWGHGRSTVLSRMEAGRLDVRLKNHHRAYDPRNADSPYYEQVLPGKRIRVTALYNGAEYVRFEGSISQWSPEWVAGGRGSYIRVSATDDFTPLGRVPISSPAASLTTSMAGANNDIVLTAKGGGGNDIRLSLIKTAFDLDPAEVEVTTTTRWVDSRDSSDEWLVGPPATPVTNLEITNRDILVRLRVAAATITTTAQQLVDLINNDPNASILVSAALAGASGAGIVTELADAPLVGGERASETTGKRIGWVLRKLGVPDDRQQLDAGGRLVQPVTLDREGGLEHAQLVAATELGQLFWDSAGNAVFHDAERRRNSAITAAYSDEPGAGEYLYVNATPATAADQIFNNIQVSAPGLPTVEARDDGSAQAYWPSVYEHVTLLTTSAEMEDRSVALLDLLKQPVEQLESMRIEPMREAVGDNDPTSWPTALRLEVSDRLHIRRAPPGGGEIRYEAFVEGVAEEVTMGETRTWRMGVGLSVATAGATGADGTPGAPPDTPGDRWRLEDAEFSILGSTTRLG